MKTPQQKYEKDLRFYNRWAGDYERSAAQRHRARAHENLLDRLTARGVTPKRVLDVGCGTGALLRRIAQRFPDAELTGVDPAANMLKVAEEKSASDFACRYVQSGAESLPFEDGEFDVVLSTLCFHHWLDRTAGVAEVSRVLSSGGTFGLADHFAIGWTRPFFAIGGSRDRVLTQAEIAGLFASQGLAVKEWSVLYRLAGRLPFVHGVIAQPD